MKDSLLAFNQRHWKRIRLAAFVVLDTLAVAFAYWGAFVLRLDSVVFAKYVTVFAKTLPLVAAVHVAVYSVSGVYNQVLRFANLRSAVEIVKATVIATILFVALTYVIGFDPMPPRSVPAIALLLTTFLSLGWKFSWRMWSDYRRAVPAPGHERCFIYGAGSAGELLARFVASNPRFPYTVVGFVDDDRNKGRGLLHGMKIFGTGDDLKQLAARHRVKTVILAMHVAPGKTVRDIVGKCQAAGLKPLIMPDIGHALGSDVIQPRAVDVRDLLRRSPKSIDVPQVSRFFEGTTVLVTGAGGSIGSEICRQLVGFKPRKIILFDASEYNLYQIHTELVDSNLGDVTVVPVLGSLLDERVVRETLAAHRPEIVLHAAAYKHVFLVESNPLQGIVNNVLSTKIIAEAAVEHGVRSFLLVSSDKAVRPTSVMGATKRCCEVLVSAMHQRHGHQCRFAAVRFGNVLGSSGSVIPRFMKQIQSGGPLTVTHPEVTRFFMLASEAVGLVLQSIAMAKGGETFVLNMGQSVNIHQMALQLVRLAGKVPGQDIDIVFTGLLPGEKLYEELILEGSEQKTLHDDVFVAVPQNFDGEWASRTVEGLIVQASYGRVEEALRLLWEVARYESGDSKPKQPAVEFHSTGTIH
ncbi:MAG: nucleoside-diphosphate sugar epimerase/dehydratase [Polyangiaceae bacterium]